MSSPIDIQSIIERSPLDVDPDGCEVIAEYTNTTDTSDPSFFIEVLCDIEEQDYLLYGYGNSESPWSIENGGVEMPGEGAEFITRDEAHQWMAKRSIE